MAYIKTDWTDGMVISEAGLDHLENGVYNNSVAIGDLTDLDTTDKTNLVAAINEAAQSGGGGGGMSNAVKDALLQIASKVAYIDADGQDYYDDLYDALYPGATIVSINADYTQTGTVYTTTSLEDLRNDLVVNAIYDNGSVVPVISYTLSGTLEEGTSTITVTYEGLTDTFDVEVSAVPTVSSISAVYTQSGTVYDTDSLDSLKSDLVVTATYSDSSTETVPSADYTLSGTLTAGTSTITVTYEGKTTTFNVTVSENRGLPANYTWLYDARSGELLSEQDYITKTTSGGTTSETIVDDALEIHADHNGTASGSTSVLLTFAFSDTTTTNGVLTTRLKPIALATDGGSAGAGLQLQLSNGTSGTQVWVENNNGLISISYYTGGTRNKELTSFGVDEYHIFEVKLQNGKQTLSIDGTQVYESSTLSTNYTTVNRIRLQAVGYSRTPNGVTADIDWLTYYEVA